MAQGALQAQVQQLQHTLAKRMCGFGRQCRGMGNVLVTRVRQTEAQLLEQGRQVLPRARAVPECLPTMPQRSADQRARLDTQITAALTAYHRIASQSCRLTQGHTVRHCNIDNAYDPTIAPIGNGKSHCPTLACICPWGIPVMPVMWHL
jgi:hypothetical protein